MEKFLDKISVYEILNNILPGVIFTFLLDAMCGVTFNMDNIVAALFIYYFIGVVISRIGSLLIGPFLKKIKLLEIKDYGAYKKADERDQKLQLFLGVRNMYRSFIAMILMLGVAKILQTVILKYPNTKTAIIWIGLVCLLVLFVASFIKQNKFILKRIDLASEEEQV